MNKTFFIPIRLLVKEFRFKQLKKREINFLYIGYPHSYSGEHVNVLPWKVKCLAVKITLILYAVLTTCVQDIDYWLGIRHYSVWGE